MRRILPLAVVAAMSLLAWLGPGAARGAPGDGPGLTAFRVGVAPCPQSMRGTGIPLSRSPSKRLGSFGIFEFTEDYRRLRRHGNRLMRNKAPIGVSGAAPVTVTVPERARHRIALAYGGLRGRYAEIRFEPCPRKRRTVWAGGLLLRDRQPLTLRVRIGEARPRPLRLGRRQAPRTASPPSTRPG